MTIRIHYAAPVDMLDPQLGSPSRWGKSRSSLPLEFAAKFKSNFL